MRSRQLGDLPLEERSEPQSGALSRSPLALIDENGGPVLPFAVDAHRAARSTSGSLPRLLGPRRLPVHDTLLTSPADTPAPRRRAQCDDLRSIGPYDPHERSARAQIRDLPTSRRTSVQTWHAATAGSKTLAFMSLKPKKIGFTEEAIHIIAREAHHSGMTFSAYVAEAAFARAMYDWARRGADGADEYAELLDAAGRFLHTFRDDEDGTEHG